MCADGGWWGVYPGGSIVHGRCWMGWAARAWSRWLMGWRVPLRDWLGGPLAGDGLAWMVGRRGWSDGSEGGTVDGRRSCAGEELVGAADDRSRRCNRVAMV